MTSRWTDDELHRVGNAVELDLASRGPDGQLSGYTTMWVVRVGDDLYVRSAAGPGRPWHRHAVADAGVHAAIDAAYHAKYDRHGPGPVSHVTGAAAYPVTIRLVRRTP